MKNKQHQDRPGWLAPALDYTQDWLSFQVERYRQPGCTMAIAQGNELVAEYAFGHADLRTKQRMTPRHRFRIASHSKSFTASGVLLLREQGKLGLDDPIGRYVQGLHKDLAGARIAELLSHGALHCVGLHDHGAGQCARWPGLAVGGRHLEHPRDLPELWGSGQTPCVLARPLVEPVRMRRPGSGRQRGAADRAGDASTL